MQLNGIEAFVAVVDAMSFTRAATRLEMPITTVSAQIARLEEHLGVTLIRRTTRQLQVTPEGRAYYERCVRALAELSDGARELAIGTQEPAGLLRLIAPVNLSQTLLPPIIERFLQAFPKASVELIGTDRKVNLIAEAIDLAIHPGEMEDSTLVARKFRPTKLCLWASSTYLELRGTPQTPADLKRHDLISFTRRNGQVRLTSPDGKVLEWSAASRLALDGFDMIRTFIARGNGIGLLPDVVAEEPSATAPLIRVLPNYSSEDCVLHFVYPAQRFVPQTVRAFIKSALAHDAAFSLRPLQTGMSDHSVVAS